MNLHFMGPESAFSVRGATMSASEGGLKFSLRFRLVGQLPQWIFTELHGRLPFLSILLEGTDTTYTRMVSLRDVSYNRLEGHCKLIGSIVCWRGDEVAEALSGDSLADIEGAIALADADLQKARNKHARIVKKIRHNGLRAYSMEGLLFQRAAMIASACSSITGRGHAVTQAGASICRKGTHVLVPELTPEGRPLLYRGSPSHIRVPLHVLELPLDDVKTRLRRRLRLTAAEETLAATQKILDDLKSAYDRDYPDEPGCR